jgi:hypothetical protein
MNDKSSTSAPLFFVTKSGLGFEEGVYSQEELQSLPAAARPFVISLAVAESLGYVILDHKNANSISDCQIFAAPEEHTGKINKYRGVREGTIDNPKVDEEIVASAKKVGNALRTKLADIKQKQTEESLKAKIEAKKKELNTIKDN